MVQITEELIRKRAEHNEGILSTLKEITLHQFDIEKIELVGTLCRELQILYLASKRRKFASLERFAVLELGCELHRSYRRLGELRKLGEARFDGELCRGFALRGDLASELQTEGPVRCLPLCFTFSLTSLPHSFLMGNPCANLPGYRLFVIATLPQLEKLDGEEITKAERILAGHKLPELRKQMEEKRKEIQQRKANPQEKEIKYDEQGNRLYGWSPEERAAAAKDLHEKRQQAGVNDRSVDASKIGEVDRAADLKKVVLTPEQEIEKYGRVMQKNEGRWEYKLTEDKDHVILDVPVGKFLSTALIDIDVQPTYARLTIKGKILQLRFPEEVRPDDVVAQRSQVTGNLKLTIPKAKNVITAKELPSQKAPAPAATTPSPASTKPSSSKQPSSSSLEPSSTTTLKFLNMETPM